MNKMILKTSILSLATAVVLVSTGCSSGGSSDAAVGTTTYSGSAADGYLQGATVFVDSNATQMWESDEQNTTTDVNGDFTLNSPIADGTRIYAYGGIDKSTGLPFEGRLSTLFYANEEPVISPLTTYVSALVDNSMSVTDARALVAASLGLNAADVNKDPMSAPALFFASQKVQKTAEVLAAATGGDFNTAFENALTSLATITQNNSTGGDFNATAFVAQVEKDANITIATEVTTFLEAMAQKSNTLRDQNLSLSELDAAGAYLSAYGDSVEGILESGLASSDIDAITADLLGTDINTSTLATDLIDVQSFLDNNVTYLGVNSADDNITTNLVLTQSTGDYTVSWMSSNITAITTAGDVTRSDMTDEAVTMTVTVNKGLAIGSKAFDLTVQRNEYAPTAQNATLTILEDATAAPVVLVYGDANGDALSVTAVSVASHGTASLVEGNVTYAPNLNFNGTDSFTYTVTDSTGLSTTADVNVTITPANDATVWNTPNTLSLAEDFETFNIELNATDVDGVVTYRVLGTSDNIGATVSGSTLTVSSVLNASGNETIMLAATEDGIDANLTIAVTVTPVNDAPVAGTFTPLATIAEDSLYAFEAVAVDVDSANLAYSLLNNPAWMSISPSTGAVSGTPTNADVGTASNIQVLVTDGITASPVSIATFSVTVTNTNDAPVANNGTLGTLKNTLYSGVLSASDVDVGDTLTYAIVSQTAANGTVAIINPATGAFTYNPTTDYFGDGSFTFTVTDANGSLSNTATMTISVVDAIINVVANDDAQAIAEDSEVVVDVLANDVSTYDFNGSVATGTVISAVSTPVNGTATIVSGGISYAPNENFNGVDTFTYTVQTLSGETDTATVTVTVSAVEDATVWNPVILNSVDEDFTQFSVELNASDADGAVTYALVSTNGVVNASVSGSTLTISPIANANGLETITVSATQGGKTVTHETTLMVNAVNDAPTAVADSFNILANTNANPLAILSNDSDAEGNLTIASCKAPTSGSLFPIKSGETTLYYTPNTDFGGVDTFNCTITDGEFSASADVTVNVSLNNPPKASGAMLTMILGETITGNIAASDEDGDTLTYAVESINSIFTGSTLNSATGAFSIHANALGQGDIVVRVTDNGTPIQSTTATYNITVIEAGVNNNDEYGYSQTDETMTGEEFSSVSAIAMPIDTKLYDIWGTNRDENGTEYLRVGFNEFLNTGQFIRSAELATLYGYAIDSNNLVSVSEGSTTYVAENKKVDFKLLAELNATQISQEFNLTMPASAVAYKTAMQMSNDEYYIDGEAAGKWENSSFIPYTTLSEMVENTPNAIADYNQNNNRRVLAFAADQNLSSGSGTVVELDMTAVYDGYGGEPYIINSNAGTWTLEHNINVDNNNSEFVQVHTTLSGYQEYRLLIEEGSSDLNGDGTSGNVVQGSFHPAGGVEISYYFNDVTAAVLQNVYNPVTPQEYMDLNLSRDMNATEFASFGANIDPSGATNFELSIDYRNSSLLFQLTKLEYKLDDTFVVSKYYNGVAGEVMNFTYNIETNGTVTILDLGTPTFLQKISRELNASEITAMTGFAMPEAARFYEVAGMELIYNYDIFDVFTSLEPNIAGLSYTSLAAMVADVQVQYSAAFATRTDMNSNQYMLTFANGSTGTSGTLTEINITTDPYTVADGGTWETMTIDGMEFIVIHPIAEGYGDSRAFVMGNDGYVHHAEVYAPGNASGDYNANPLAKEIMNANFNNQVF